MGNFQPFHDRQSLWAEFYKIGLQLWQLPEDSKSRPEVFDNNSDQVYYINEYAYWFAESCLDDFDSKWKKQNVATQVHEALKKTESHPIQMAMLSTESEY